MTRARPVRCETVPGRSRLPAKASRVLVRGRLGEWPQRAIEPRASERPLVLDGCGREIQGGRGFFDAQAGEVPQRDDLRLSRVALLEARQRLVDGYEIRQRR